MNICPNVLKRRVCSYNVL